MKRLLLLASALVATTPIAHAQSTPPPAQAPAATTADAEAEESDEIVVLANRGDQVQIDRRTYTIRDDPAAQSTNMFDILGRVPSVSVAPSGAVTLLGADNVTIQINGQPTPGQNLEQVLRGIPGADVERIEVMTNPGAQQSAATSGGIINIITRQRFNNAGLTGSVQGGYDNLDSWHFGVSPNWSRGPWSLSGSFGGWGGEQTQDFERERRILGSGVTTFEEGDQDLTFGGFYVGRATLGYRPTPKQRYSVALDLTRGGNDILRDTETTLSGAPVSEQTNLNQVEFSNTGLTFDAQLEGAQPREVLKMNLNVGNNGLQFDQEFTFDPVVGVGQEVTSRTEHITDTLNARAEYERPFGEQFLTAGLSFDMSEAEIENERDTILGPAIPPDFLTLLEGRQQTQAGYGTYQFELGGFTLQPGVRIENYRREVVSGGLETDTTDLRTFPSIHIRRELWDSIAMDLSYTSRIQRPQFQQLDPALRFVDTNRAVVGNPNLDPSLTDAYEANFTYQSDGRSYGLTFYDRISEDVFSPFTETLVDGTIVTRPVNAGVSEQRGLQAILRGPLVENWRYSASVNLMEREFDFLTGGVIERRNEFEYDGVVSLDYRDGDQNAIGADQLQLEVRFQGPRHTLQSDLDAFTVANITWRRKLTDRLYGTLTAQDIFSSQDNINEVTTDTYFERTETQSPGMRVRLGFTYQFGDGPRRPPPDQQQTPGGPPQIPQ